MANNSNSITPGAGISAPGSALDIAKRGLGLWVHQTKAAIGQLHAIAALDFDYLVVKVADGANTYQAFYLDQVEQGARTLGLPLVAWAFCYPKKGKGQVKAIASACKGRGIKDVVLDMEGAWEYKGAAADARDFISDLKSAMPGVRFHLSTFYALSKHPDFPFTTAMTLCESFMPQAYRKGDKTAAQVWEETVAEYTRLGFHSLTVVPTVDTPDVLETIAAANHSGGDVGAGARFMAASVWLWDGDGSNAGDSDIGVMGQEKLWTPAIQAFRGSVTR